MNIWLNSPIEIILLLAGLFGFLILAKKNFFYAVWLTVFLALFYLLRFKLFFLPLNVFEILVWLLFLIWLFGARYRKADWRAVKRVLWPVILIVLGVIISTILSEDLRVSLGIFRGWFLSPLVLGVIVYSETKSGQEAGKILWAVLASSFAVSLAAVYYFLQGKLVFDGRLAAFFLSPNHLAMYVAPGVIIAAGLIIGASDRLKFKAAVGKGLFWMLVFCAAVLYLTYSYAAWLSVLIVIVILFIGRFVLFPERALRCAGRVEGTERNFTLRQAQGIKFRLWSVFFVFFLLVAALFFLQLGSEKMDDLLHSSRSSWQSRLAIWKTAMEIGRDHPLFGIGPGMFQDHYLKYQVRFAVPYLEWAVPQPHNVFLAFWLQTGLLGLAGFVWLIVLFFRKIFKGMGVAFSQRGLFEETAGRGVAQQENVTPIPFLKQGYVAVILGGLMIYFLLHGLVDTTYFKNDSAALFWILISLCSCINKNNR